MPGAKTIPAYLVRNYKGWRTQQFEENKVWYARLAEGGQHPRTMLISCCDSRVNAVSMFGAEPGDLFVVRNVASIVPPYKPDQERHGTSAAVEFAVGSLKVAHIVVMGHSDCGGVKACNEMCAGLAPDLEKDTSFIGRWMDLLRPAYDKVAPLMLEEAEHYRRMEQEGVLVSLRNLETFPMVRDAVAAGVLTLHGAWMNIGEGRLYGYESSTDRFESL